MRYGIELYYFATFMGTTTILWIKADQEKKWYKKGLYYLTGLWTFIMAITLIIPNIQSYIGT